MVEAAIVVVGAATAVVVAAAVVEFTIVVVAAGLVVDEVRGRASVGVAGSVVVVAGTAMVVVAPGSVGATVVDGLGVPGRVGLVTGGTQASAGEMRDEMNLSGVEPSDT